MNSCITIKEIEFLIIKLYQRPQLSALRVGGVGDGGGGERGRRGRGGMHTYKDSLPCTAETNTGVKRLTPIKDKIKTFTQRFPRPYDFTGNFPDIVRSIN